MMKAQKVSAFLAAIVTMVLLFSKEEASMLELLKGLAIAILMVPIVMAIILGLIYGLGEIFNVISKVGHRDRQAKNHQ